jgi:FkbM family methyltransferase
MRDNGSNWRRTEYAYSQTRTDAQSLTRGARMVTFARITLMMKVNTPAHAVLFSSAIRTIDVLQRVYMRIVAYISPVKDCRTVFGALMRCHTRDFIQRRIRFFGIFEHNLTYYSLNKLRDGDLFLDIGANVGYFTLLASRSVGPNGKVISIEADPVTFQGLTANLELNGCRNVSARNVAATETACRVTIEPGQRHNSGSNRIVLGPGKGSVEGLSLRDILGEDIGRVRFIKIDIELSEGPVLDEILHSLANLRDDVIVASEVSRGSAEYIERFVSAGFEVYSITNIYTIDYYLISSYMRKYNEHNSVNMVPVAKYNPLYQDYIFERTHRSSSYT